MEFPQTISQALGDGERSVPSDGRTRCIPVDEAFVARVRDGAVVDFLSAPSIDAPRERGQMVACMLSSNFYWNRFSLDGKPIGQRELLDDEVNHVIRSLVDPVLISEATLDSVAMSPLQRARLSSQLAAVVSELVSTKVPIQRARLAKSINELLSQLDGSLASPKNIEPIELTGLELGSFPSTPEGIKALRATAIDALEAMLGDWVPCPALGVDVELRRAGLKKVKSTSADPRKLKIIPVLKKLIGSAVKVGVKPNYDKANSPNILEYQTLRSLVTLAGQELAVRFVVGRDDKGAYHYDHSVFLSEVIFDSENENGLTEMSPLILPGGNQGCTQSRSAVPEPTRLLSIEPSTKQQDERILDDSRAIVKPREVFNLFFDGEEDEVVTQFPDEKVLTDIAEGRRDGDGLDALYDLIHEAVMALEAQDELAGDVELTAQGAVTHWAELEEQTNG